MNLVVRFDGWVLEQIAREFAKHVPGAKVVEHPEPGTNVYFPYYLFREPTGCDIAVFTHREDPARGELAAAKAAKFDEVAERADWCIAMSKATAALLPPDKTTVIEPPPHPRFHQRLVLGVAGIEQPFGRKRTDWLNRLAQDTGAQVVMTNGGIPAEDMPEFYRRIHYLLVVSENEGGPMSVPEAIASGTPVIAPDVGWCWEYPVLRYSGYDELVKIVKRLMPPTDAWAKAGAELQRVRHDLLVRAA